MSTAVVTDHFDEEIESIISEETTPTALVLQGVVSMERIPTGDIVTYRRISSAGSDAATNIKRFESLFEKICSQRHAHWQAATAARARKLDPFKAVKAKASQLLGAFDQEAERLRLQEETRRQKAAQEDAEREAAENRKLAEAEAKRLSDEQAITDAIALEAEGDSKGAEAVLNNPAPVPVYVPPVYVVPVVVPKAIPKIEGKSSSTSWKFCIQRAPECRAPGDHDTQACSTCLAQVPRDYLILDSKRVGQLVRASKDKTNIPGVTVFPEGAARFKG